MLSSGKNSFSLHSVVNLWACPVFSPFPFWRARRHQKFFMFLKCSIKSFTIDLHGRMVTKLDSMKSWSTTTYLSQSAIEYKSEVCFFVFTTCLSFSSFLHSRWKVQLSNNSQSLSQFSSFFFSNGLSFGLLRWKEILGFRKRCCSETFCPKQQKDPPWTHFKLTTPLHTAQVNISLKYTSFTSSTLIGLKTFCSHIKQPWILWSRIYLDKDLCVSSYLPRF